MAKDDDKPGAPERSYEVGKGKPPRHTQFKPGERRANRGGRPRKPSQEEQARRTMSELLKETVRIREGERVMKVTAFEAYVRRLRAKALSAGCTKAGREWIELSMRFGALFSEPDTGEIVSPNHKAIIARYLARIGGDDPPDEPGAPQAG